MRLDTFSAFCHFEIGDIVRVKGSEGYSVVTDIAFVYYAKTKQTECRIEFDNNGVYKLIAREEAVKNEN